MNEKTIKFSNEQRLVILLARVSFSKEESDELHEIIQKNLNWYKVLEFLIKNKILGLGFSNLKKLSLDGYVDLLIHRQMICYFNSNHKRNVDYLLEFKRIEEKLCNSGIRFGKLKGLKLLENDYYLLGERSINDLDILIDYHDYKKIDEVMKELNYKKGHVDRHTKNYEPFSKEKELTWNLKMSNLPTYVKIVNNNENISSFEIDFSIFLNLDRNFEAVDEMLTTASNGNLIPAHFIVHMCCHLYKEADSPIWISKNSDLNLIKFIDIREYILKKLSEQLIKDIVNFSTKYMLDKPIYFTMFYLRELYNDGYENEILSKLEVNNNDFMDFYGHNDFEEILPVNVGFWERIFGENVIKIPIEYKERYEKYLNL